MFFYCLFIFMNFYGLQVSNMSPYGHTQDCIVVNV